MVVLHRSACLLGILLLCACSDPTELMLVVKAGPGLTFGPGQEINVLGVRVQQANSPPTQWFYTRTVDLCPVSSSPTATCRPQQYATANYDGALTLPVHLLFSPGSQGLNDDVRVWVDALPGNNTDPAKATTPVLTAGVRFHFSEGHRLWLELPLFEQCLGVLTCQAMDQVCGIDKNCTSLTATGTDPDKTTDLAGGHTDMSSTDAGSGVVDLATADGADLAVSTPQDMSGDMTAVVDMVPSGACGVSGIACCDGGLCASGICVTTASASWPPQVGTPAAMQTQMCQ